MPLLAVLLGIIVAVLLLRRWFHGRGKRADSANLHTPAISVSIENPGFNPRPDMGQPVLSGKPGFWVINPKGGFRLTIHPATEEIARDLKRLLDQNGNWTGSTHGRAIEELLLRKGLRCQEVDEYVAQYKRKYLEAIERAAQNSAEWKSASDLDREDLREEFAKKALNGLEVKPGVSDLRTLFSDRRDLSGTRALVERYGFEVVQFYSGHAADLMRIHVVSPSHLSRPVFEEMVRVGLASRGEEVSLENVLRSLTLKELQEIVARADAPVFRRKAAAIEYGLGLSDIKERLSSRVALREYFQLRSLPSQYGAIDLVKVVGTIAFTREVCRLLSHTYMMSQYDLRDINDSEISKFVDGWKIEATDTSCALCLRAAAKVYRKEKRPRTPLHIGCRCCVSTIMH